MIQKLLCLLCVCTSIKDKKYNKNKPAKECNKSKSSKELNATLILFVLGTHFVAIGGVVCLRQAKPDSEKRWARRAMIDEYEDVAFEKRVKNADNQTVVALWEKICAAEKREDLKALIKEKKDLKEIIEAEIDIGVDAILALAVWKTAVWKTWPIIRKMFPQYDKDEVILAKGMRCDEISAVFDQKKIDGYNLPNGWMFDILNQIWLMFRERGQFLLKEIRATEVRTSVEEKDLVVRKDKEFWEMKVDAIFAAEEWKTWSVMQQWKIVELNDTMIQTCFQEIDDALHWICDIIKKLFPEESKKLAHGGLNHFDCDTELVNQIKRDLRQELIKHKDEEKGFVAKLNKSMTKWDLCDKIREFRSEQMDTMIQSGACNAWPSIQLFRSSKRDEAWIRQWLDRGRMKIDNSLGVENMDLLKTCLNIFITWGLSYDSSLYCNAMAVKAKLDPDLNFDKTLLDCHKKLLDFPDLNLDKTLLDCHKKLLDFILQKAMLDYIKLITVKYNQKAKEFIEKAIKSETSIFKIWEFQDRDAKEVMESEVMKNLLKKIE